ncbi:glucose-6-phosphate dehydrogenase [Cellulomonas soli]|nr:glucose-6-phosphate dehydrogenase [Cellulomonas soli]NYI59998.1 glucose-6-phosphate 1-dehydrogenase [Cellulomonas soli]
MVLFGASGDLARRLLLPAVAQLVAAGALPPGLSIVGSADTDWTTETFREHVASALRAHSTASAEAHDQLLQMLTFRPADVTRAADVAAVLGEGHAATLVYLALPPALLHDVLPALAAAGLGAADAVAIEKPFGTDLASARELNELLRLRLPAPTVFRVDHFLSSELVRRVVTLRFLNRVFSPAWHAEHVERIDISWLEDLTLEGRASYYDRAGALKDMLQNHLMEVMALVLMEQPARMDAHSFRAMRVEALRAVATPDPARVRASTVRARYTAGTIGSRAVPSYVDEPGVDPALRTETYAALTLEVDSPRWSGVPVTIRSGKALAASSAEIAVHFRPVPRYLTEQWPGVEPNVLRLGLTEPYVHLSTTLNGPDRTAEPRRLETVSSPPPLSPYANLVREMLQGDPMLFIRGDEAEEAWRIVDPVVRAWSAQAVPLQEYRAGGTPPGPVA